VPKSTLERADPPPIGRILNGNLRSDGTLTYTYDNVGEGRITSVLANATQATVATYKYDPFGRRYSKTVGVLTTVYLRGDGNREVGEYDGSGNLQRRLFYGDKTGPASTTPIGAIRADGSKVFFHPDAQGSVVATSDQTGAITWQGGYLPYGESPGGASASGFGYAGYRYDAETGLYYVNARYYSPALGRFLQPDPIGGTSGVNLYAYVANDPLNRTDPSGLCDNPQGCGGASNQLLASPAAPTGINTVISTASQPTTPTASGVPQLIGLPTITGTVGPDLTQTSGSSGSSPGSIQVAAKSPTLYCQNVECGAPTGGVVCPLCPTCNNHLKNGGPPILLENGQIIVKPIEPEE
jgi:RHS repeat-associated protein